MEIVKVAAKFSKADDLIKAIESEFKKVFPKSLFNGFYWKKDSAGISISFILAENEADLFKGYWENDPMHHQFRVGDREEVDNQGQLLGDSVTLTLQKGGGLRVLEDPEQPNKGTELLRAKWDNGTTPIDSVASKFASYFKNLKSIVSGNENRIRKSQDLGGFTKQASTLFSAKGKYKLEDYAQKIADLTEFNDHSGAMVLAATLTGDKPTIRLAEAVKTIVEIERNNPISQYSSRVSQRIDYVGRKVYGEDYWNEHIYSNM